MNVQQTYPINKHTDVDGAILTFQLAKTTRLDTYYLNTPCLQIRNGNAVITKININTKQYRVHRFLWYYHYPTTPLQSNIKACCGTDHCMNILHLQCVTKKMHSAQRKHQPRVVPKTFADVFSVPCTFASKAHENVALWIFADNENLRYVDMHANIERLNTVPQHMVKHATEHTLVNVYGLDALLFQPASLGMYSLSSALGIDDSEIPNFEPEDLDDLHELEVYGDY